MTGAVLLRPPVRVEIYPRRVWDWFDLVDAGPGPSIALDGMVMGGPRYDEKMLVVNFDHHDGVVREATMSTAMQVYFAIKGGLMSRFINPTIYINDTDQDKDGSQQRYLNRWSLWAGARLGGVQHYAWWLVHNLIAHPLIGLVPIKPAFDLHDWTSHRMHRISQQKTERG